jgi:DNA-binding NarL/FixJ family response regulator
MLRVRVMIVDDQALFRAGLAALLDGSHAEHEVRVIAQAHSGEAALSACAVDLPDVVLMDMRMPGMDGVECTRRLLERHPQLRILALSTFDDDETVLDAIRAGAVGYLLKDASADTLLDAVRRAAAGDSIVDPSVLTKVLGELRRISATAAVDPHGLSEREVAVLRGLMDGKSNKEIGSALHIAEGTVKNHLTSIFQKLGVTDRTSAAMRGRDLGLDRKRSRS